MFLAIISFITLVCHIVELFEALRLHILFYVMLPMGTFVWDMEVKSTIAPSYDIKFESQTGNYVLSTSTDT